MNVLNPQSQDTALMTRRSFCASLLATATVAVAACSQETSTSDSGEEPETSDDPSADATVDSSIAPTIAPTTNATTDPGSTNPSTTAVTRTDFYDSSVLHTISVEFDEDDFDAMIDDFVDNGEKGWIEAEATIDGHSYRQVGMRLKGNSSLGGLGGAGGPFPGGGPRPDGTGTTTTDTPTTGTDVTAVMPDVVVRGGFDGLGSASADEPEGLPWLMRLDKYVDDQSHDGLTEFVVRSSSTETALNEAVSVGLLAAAGLATQRAAAVEFTVNDRPARLRLVLENPNEDWMSANLGDGKLYKADASGNYSYRGDDPASYTEAWEQEGGEDDLTPLIAFLDFVNNSDDAAFAADLDEHLDIDAFAEYMAIEDLLQNFDDISGPGNNSYLYYDDADKRFTVVAWDHNLALSGAGPGGIGELDPAQLPGGTLPDGFDPSQMPGGTVPEGVELPPDGVRVGGFGGSNALADRFMSTADFSALYDEALVRLRSDLFESGAAQRLLDQWSNTLLATATHLVDEATIKSEAEAIAEFFVAE